MSRTVKDMRDARRELRRHEVRERRRRRQESAEGPFVFGFLRERGSRRVQPSTASDRIEVVA